MTILIPTLLDKLEYKIKQADHFKTYHFCEACKLFSEQRPCKYNHDKRYWALRHFKTLHFKLSNGHSLNSCDLLLLEAIAE